MAVLLTDEAFLALANAISPPDGTAFMATIGETRLIEGIGEVREALIIQMTYPTGPADGVPTSDSEPEDDPECACFDDCCT